MRIQSVDAFLLSYPLPEPLHLRYFGGERTILKRDAMLILVHTASYVGYAPGQGSEKSKQIIDTVIAPFLKGRTLADPDALRVLFFETSTDLEIQKVYCAVEIALWDIVGKHKGLPVSELMGGRVRDRIALYGSAGMYMSPEGYAKEAAGVAALGFLGYKMRPAMGPDQDVETVRQIREAVGPAVDIMVDAHTWWRMGDRSYAPETIAAVAERLADFDICWLEEPLDPSDHAALARLKQLDVVPIASGEHEPNEDRYLNLIAQEAVDYVQMDIVCQGGYPLARRLFAEIERREMKFAFHSWGTSLEVLAAAHVGICWPMSVVEWLEYPCHSNPPGKPERVGMYPFPLAEEILKEPLRIENGDLVVPTKPGLGIDVDESVIERYPWIPGPWSFFRLDSPAGTWAVTSDHSVPWADPES